MNILITSGGTKIKIDRVRHIGNMSSGTFGAKIALECLKRGHTVMFFKAKGSKGPLGCIIEDTDSVWDAIKKVGKAVYYKIRYDRQLVIQEYTDFDSYRDFVMSIGLHYRFDAVVLAAAVSDYGVDNYVDGKIRSSEDDMSIQLKKLPKIIADAKKVFGKAKIVGFKLLVDSTETDLIQAAIDSVDQNNCAFVVANDLRDIQNSNHIIRLVFPEMIGDGRRCIETYKTIRGDNLALEVVKGIEHVCA